MSEEKISRQTKLRLNLTAIYCLLLIGFAAPLINSLLTSDSFKSLLNTVLPAFSALLVAWFQKSAAQLLKEGASFAIPGVYVLRQKYLRHVNRLEKAWLALAAYALVWAAL
jgi:hypothetical protein